MGTRVEVRPGESLRQALRKLRKRVELARRKKAGKPQKAWHEKPGAVRRRKRWAARLNRSLYSYYGELRSWGWPLPVLARRWLGGGEEPGG